MFFERKAADGGDVGVSACVCARAGRTAGGSEDDDDNDDDDDEEEVVWV